MELAFRTYGEGQPLIILHGLFGQSDNWNSLARKFAEQGLKVFTVDLRNHGLSPHSHLWNYEVMAEDVYELINRYHLQNCILLGHSMGGKTAMYVAQMFPEVLSKLIVADIAPKAYPPHHNEVLKALNSVNFENISTRKEAEAQLNEYIKDFGVKQFLLKNIYWEDSAEKKMNWRFNLPVISENYNMILAEVPEITSLIPTLFLRGSKSNYIDPQTDIACIERRFPNYTLETIENSGHWIHAEQPEAFFKAVMQFIHSGL